MVLAKTFDFADAESRIYEAWESAGCFRAGANARPGAKPYCIVIPPPNVTGALHMGHALNCTVQDVLIRWHRMRGFDTLWQPGVDHAGIATQMVVERELARAGEPGRKEMTREAFLERVWEWKGRYGGAIGQQFRRLGASCDWSRERFTLDEGLSRAVRAIFVQLFDEGLIYRGERLVNWDPHFETAISDLEVEHLEMEGKLWHFRYPFEDGDGHLEVATTRPETMLGDTAVAVHPEDPRYRGAVGRWLCLPLTGRRIPVIADRHVDPETGTGVLKITPAHDFNDFEIGRRAGLTPIRVMDSRARIAIRDHPDFREAACSEGVLALHGLDRFEARTKVVEMIEAQGLLAGVEDHRHIVPHGDRSKVPVEPHLTEQWFVDAAALAKPALDAVRQGRTRFHPKNWETTYFRWLEGIEPWCISRQLWWGHRIPVWYGPDGQAFAKMDADEAHAAAEAHYGAPTELVQDEDVLDTWFSSALWPFSTLGWPEATPELERYYPTGVLVTAFDIIFFWVARMMMLGLHSQKDEAGGGVVPFHDVYVHAIVRDEQGVKMSKSLGNVLDPILLIDKYGADAVRCTLVAMAAKGRDIRLSTSRIEGYRNFVTKLWNAARFAEMQGCVRSDSFNPETVREPVNRWIIGKIAEMNAELDAALADYRFDAAARALYSTVWGVFCDWYLEFTKPALQGEGAAREETRATVAWCLDRILVLAHPFMPFITECLWESTGPRAGPLVHADWPEADLARLVDPEARREIDGLIELIESIRSLRSELGVPASARPKVLVVPERKGIAERILRHTELVQKLARIEPPEIVETPPKAAAILVLEGCQICMPVAGLIDLQVEQSRLEKRLGRIDQEIETLGARLSDSIFLARAPEHVVDASRSRQKEAADERERIAVSLGRILQISAEERAP